LEPQWSGRTGRRRRAQPHVEPAARVVICQEDGTTEAIHDALRAGVRVHKGRNESPTAAIIDSQSVKACNNVPESSQGVDMAKKIKGRKAKSA
jgi:hypothetical protein